jgi:hypothetical protein
MRGFARAKKFFVMLNSLGDCPLKRVPLHCFPGEGRGPEENQSETAAALRNVHHHHWVPASAGKA